MEVINPIWCYGSILARIRHDSWKAAAYIKLCQYLQLIMEHLCHKARVIDIIVTVLSNLAWLKFAPTNELLLVISISGMTMTIKCSTFTQNVQLCIISV